MIEITHVNAVPKSGHEFQYYLAWKHRVIASEYMNRLLLSCKWWKYRQAERLWSDAMRRIREHGQDVVLRCVSGLDTR